MKALSLGPDWAMDVLLGEKRIEWRTWKTDYRGLLLICANSKPWPGSIAGHALCVVNLVDIVPFKEEHLYAAYMDTMPEKQGYAWIFDGLGWIKPFKVKGQLHLFDVPDEKIEYIPEEIDNVTALKTYYKPLMTWSNRGIKEDEVRAWWNEVLQIQAGIIPEQTGEEEHGLDEEPESQSDKEKIKETLKEEASLKSATNEISFDNALGAMVSSLREKGGLSREELIRFASKKLGYKRTGSRISNTLNSYIDEAISQNKLAEEAGAILLSFK